jgi:hypothetical protein
MVTADLRHIIMQLESDATLFEANQLQRRIDLLDRLNDELDANLGLAPVSPADTHLYRRANTLRARLEAANLATCNTLRCRIQQPRRPGSFLRWSQIHKAIEKPPAPGLGFDYLDDLATGVLQFREPEPASELGDEMVFYQPTPIRHLLHLIHLTSLTASDTLVDLGSGLGHVPILAAILTGAHSIGVELQPAYVATARECAQALGLDRVTFLQQNACEADHSTGTVFYLYTPFTGTILKTVLCRLQHESTSRPIRICTLGPCTPVIAKEPWLTPTTYPDPDQITCFHAHP